MEPHSGLNAKVSQNLVDNFFIKEDQKLIEKHRAMRRLAKTKEELAKASGIKNDAILQKLVDLNVHPETLASLSLVPLVEVAWADGTVDEEERKSVLDAVEHRGFPGGSNEYDIVIQWLGHKPSPDLLEAWLHYVQGLCEQLSPEEKKTLKNDLIGHARAVAQASGGFLGLNKISKEEDDMLKKLEGAFE